MKHDIIRPRPAAGSLADQILAIACEEKGPDGRVLGARSTAELVVWCKELARAARDYSGDLAEYPNDALVLRIVELEEHLHTCEVERATLEATIRSLVQGLPCAG